MHDDHHDAVKPSMRRLLRALDMDVAYHRAAGNTLYYGDPEGREVEVLDLVGGFGVLFLGHNCPPLVAEAQRILSSGRPVHVQGSRREYSERLARELSRRAGGDFHVVFGNSGTEAVEAAMKHAMLETGGRTLVCLERAYHGKTLGAIQLMGHEEFRKAFQLPGLNILRVPAGDLASMEAIFANTRQLAGLIMEPIQGEGGVRLVSPEFARRAAELCRLHHVPFIADECQTGLGRTGTFLASEKLGVHPDYVILSKTLGGGLAKISALLIRRERYVDAFDWIHSSTYAEDDFSSGIALKVLELIDHTILARCRERGERLLHELHRLQADYPEVIAEVRGAGLLVGVEFRREPWSSFVLRMLSAQEQLVYLLAAFLFHTHRIRVAPTLSDPFTLRIEPSVFLSNDEIDQLIAGLRDVCARMRSQDALGLTQFLIDAVETHPEKGLRPVRSRPTIFAYDASRLARHADGPAVRVAWLCHLLDADGLNTLDAVFGDLSSLAREQYLRRFAPFASPVVMSATDIRARNGQVVRLYPIMLPVSSRTMKDWIDRRQVGLLRGMIRQGVEVGRSLGCRVLSLGQYTSIGTSGGRSLHVPDICLTNGNSYTVALVARAIRQAERGRGRAARNSVLAVVGAAGNVGRACAEILAPDYSRTILIGSIRPGSQARLKKLAARLPRSAMAVDLAWIGEADTVVVAVNTVEPLLGRERFARGAIVCDVSCPAAVAADPAALRPDLLVINGGIASLPGGEDVGIVGFPLPVGQVYGCMAEAVILGFEGRQELTFTGPLTTEHVRFVDSRAEQLGFELADFATGPVITPLTTSARRSHRVHTG